MDDCRIKLFEHRLEMFTKEERKILIELICNEQTYMIVKDHTKYDSDKYKNLEKLKIKIKDMWGEMYARHYNVQ